MSVIIPVHNVYPYLRKAVCSVLSSKFDNYEVILVENGSTDGSFELCDELEKEDSRIRVVHTEGKGVSNARNIGIGTAEGKWLFFMDSDDWLEEGVMDSIIGIVNVESDEYDMYCFNANRSYEDAESISKKRMTDIFPDNYVIKQDEKNELISALVCSTYKRHFYAGELIRAVWGKLLRKDIIISNDIKFNDKLVLGEDCVFLVEYLLHVKKAILKNIYIYNYRIRSGSAVNSVPKEFDKQYIFQLNAMNDVLDKVNYNHLEKDVTLNILGLSCAKNYLSCLRRLDMDKSTRKKKLREQLNNCAYKFKKVYAVQDYNLHKREKIAYWLLVHRMWDFLWLIY